MPRQFVINCMTRSTEKLIDLRGTTVSTSDHIDLYFTLAFVIQLGKVVVNAVNLFSSSENYCFKNR